MRNRRLVIEGNEIDMGDAVIGTSYQLGDVGDLTTRKVSHSNRFTVPPTPANIKALGFAHLENSGTSKPYSSLSARLLDSNLDLFQSANAEIESADNGFSIEIYEGARQFFNSLGDKTLEDLTISNATDDYYSGHDGAFALACLGIGTDNEASTPLLPDFRKLGISYKRAVELIISSAGYTKSGAIFSNAQLGALYMWPLGDKGNYNSAFKRNKEFEARSPGHTMTVTTAFQKINFTNVVTNPGGYYDGTNTYNQFKPDGSYSNAWYKQILNAEIEITAQANLTGGVANVSIEILDSAGGVVAAISTALGVFPKTFQLIHTIPSGLVNAGNNGTSYVRIKCDSGTVDLTFGTNSRFWNQVQNTDPAIGTYKNALGLMPIGVKQKDLMKDFAVRYGVLFRERDNILYAKTWSEICTDKANAKDWTNKRDYSQKTNPLKFKFGSYAQSNLFSYQTEDDGADETTGRGDLTIPNVNLDIKKDYFQSIFTNSLTRKFGNTTAGLINCAYVSAGNEAKVRLLALRAKYSYEPNLTGPISSYNVFYFIDSTQSFDCSFGYTLTHSYVEMKAALQKAKLIDRKYILNIIDVNQLDLFYLVRDNGNYYLVNKVSNYLPDKSTSVQLFKIT